MFNNNIVVTSVSWYLCQASSQLSSRITSGNCPPTKGHIWYLLFSHIILGSNLSCPGLLFEPLSDFLDVFHPVVVIWESATSAKEEGREGDVFWGLLLAWLRHD